MWRSNARARPALRAALFGIGRVRLPSVEPRLATTTPVHRIVAGGDAVIRGVSHGKIVMDEGKVV